MRPLPPDKQHGVIHRVRVTKDNLDHIAAALDLPKKAKNRLRAGRTIHIVREADDDEMKQD
jgi:hypothetical protein